MSTRLSISNFVFAISFDQFKAMVQQYKQAAEQSFGTPCSLEIRAMNRIKMTSSFMHDDDTMDWMDKQNSAAVFFRTGELSVFLPQTFAEAVYIEVIFAPIDAKAAPNYAFAHIEFKGSRPRQATFYMQPEGSQAVENFKAKFRFKKFGDGYKHNTDY
ncbi:hypothetical protein BH11CYA1_BH11CYA1_34970 [soil metagenome]